MKLGIVVEWLDPSRGGAETSTRQFIDHLIARDISVIVFTRSRLPSRKGLNVQTIATSSRDRARATDEFIQTTERRIGEAGCDLIHAFTPCAGADVYQPRGGLVAETIERTIAARRTPVGRAMKGLTLRLNRRQQRVLARERDWLTGPRKPMVIAISRYVERQLREHYDYPAARIRFVLNGVDIRETSESQRADHRRRIRERFGIGQHDLLLLQVCHNFRLKGVGSLIEALSLLHRQGAGSMKAVVVGRGASLRWRLMVAAYRMGDMHTFAGPTDDVIPFYHAADALVHPSYYDPCSRVVLEAASEGLAVVGSRFDGAAEALANGISGVAVESPDDIVALAERIQQLFDPKVRRAMSRAATDQAKSCGLSMARHVDEVLRVYDEMKEGPS